MARHLRSVGGFSPPVEDGTIRATLTGIVRGADGEPVADATGWLPSYYGVCRPERDSIDGGFAITDAAGPYKMIIESEREHLSALLERGVSVEARGLVRAESLQPRQVQETPSTLTLDVKRAR